MLTQGEKDIVDKLKAEGRSPREIAGFIGGNRTNKPSTLKKEIDYPETPKGKSELMSFLDKETRQDIKQTGQGIFSQFKSAGEDILDIATDSDLSFGEKTRGIGSRAFSGGSRALVEEPLKGAVKVLQTQEGEDRIKQGLQDSGAFVADTQAVKSTMDIYNSLSPDSQREIKNALGFAEGLSEITGIGSVIKISKTGLSKVDDVIRNVAKNVDEPVEQGLKQTDNALNQVAKQTDNVETNNPIFDEDDFVDPVLREKARARREAEASAPSLSFTEKSIGLTTADKAQIIGKTDKMQDYIDIVKTRNATKDAPTAMEFGGDQVRNAAEEMQKVLNNTGSRIGETRTKLSSIKAPVDDVARIENTFKNQLEQLGLQVDSKGNIVRKSGVVSKVGTSSDVNTLQELWNEFKIVKQSPTLTNLLDYRNLVQKNIDFTKSAGTTSDSLNVPSSIIRRDIKEVADNLVGKSGASDLADYTNFIRAYNDIKSFTDRRAGGEYLLRVLESGRGGEAREIVNTIKKYTGVDLQDDATMMKLVTDLMADADQKTLFRQQMTSAGIDATRILSGDPTGLIKRGADAVMDKFTDPEKVLIKASQNSQSFNGAATPQSSLLDRFKTGLKKMNDDQGGFAKNPLARQSSKANESVSLPNNTTKSLTEQAKKFATKEDFEDSFLFHGTTEPKIQDGKLKFGMKSGQDSGGIFLSNNKGVSEQFTFGKGQILFVDPKIVDKVIDLSRPSGINKVKSFIGKKYKNFEGEELIFTQKDFDLMFPNNKADFATVASSPEVIEQIVKSDGKIGIAFDEFAGGQTGKTYQILEGDVPVFTKSQLEKIWKDANK